MGLHALGAVPEDPLVVRAANLGEPLAYAVRSAAGEEYRKIARRLMGQREPESGGGIGAFMQRIFGIKAAG